MQKETVRRILQEAYNDAYQSSTLINIMLTRFDMIKEEVDWKDLEMLKYLSNQLKTKVEFLRDNRS